MFEPYFDYKEYCVTEHIKEGMYSQQKEALGKLSEIVHPQYTREFMRILNYGFREEYPPARKLAEDLNLGHLDFLAFEENLEGYQGIYEKNIENEKGKYAAEDLFARD